MIWLKLNEKVYVALRLKIAMKIGAEQRHLAYMVTLAEFGNLAFRQCYMAFSSHNSPLQFLFLYQFYITKGFCSNPFRLKPQLSSKPSLVLPFLFLFSFKVCISKTIIFFHINFSVFISTQMMKRNAKSSCCYFYWKFFFFVLNATW